MVDHFSDILLSLKYQTQSTVINYEFKTTLRIKPFCMTNKKMDSISIDAKQTICVKSAIFDLSLHLTINYVYFAAQVSYRYN